jgi:HK97 family phage prohead protease
MTIRAYGLLEGQKAVEEGGKRILRGMATTPAVDRVGDIIDPMGVKFAADMPFLWQHRHDQPIGRVKFGKPTKKGIPFEAEIAQTDEPGALKDFLDNCWQQLKLGLVRAVSIGFRAVKWAWIGDYDGVEYQEIECYELSAVTIPANPEAVISEVAAAKGGPELAHILKSFDPDAPAATGRPERPAKEPPGVTGKTLKPLSLTPKEGTDMNIAEQIAALQTRRKAAADRLEEIQTGAAGENRTKSADERQEFDDLKTELKQVDEELDDLKDLERVKAAGAKAVEPNIITSSEAGARARDPRTPTAEVRLKTQEAKGVRFARLAKIRGLARLDGIGMVDAASALYGQSHEIVGMLKAAVVAGSNASGNWAAALHGTEGSGFADFAEYLRPATILGKFGSGGVPALRKVPFDEPLILQTGAGSGYWVGEGKPKPLTSFGFSRSTLGRLKVANIAVLTEENIRSTNPSSELIVRDALRDALVETQDTAFIDPTNAGSANVKPAAVTNGIPDMTVASTGDDADDIRVDVRAVMKKFVDANNPLSSGVWIMSANTALALALMVNALGQPEFPGITMMGGTFFNLPVIVSEHAGDYVVLANAQDIYEADEGEIAVDMSREASLEMKDSSLTQDGTTGTGVAMVSLWQSNLVGLRAERTINWARRRATAVAVLTGVSWGGAVPVS